MSHLHSDIEFEIPSQTVYFRNPGYTANSFRQRFAQRTELPDIHNKGVQFKWVEQCTQPQAVKLGVADSIDLDSTIPGVEHRCRIILYDNLKKKQMDAKIAWICTEDLESECKVRRIVLYPVHVSLPTFK